MDYSDQSSHADRYYGEAGAGGQELMTFHIGEAWERGKIYGFLLSFLTVDFVPALHAAAKRMLKFCVKICYEIPNGCGKNEGYTLILDIFYT